MAPTQMFTTIAAARMLGVTPETLRSWRRRGIGPGYVKQTGGWVRSRCAGTAVEIPGGGSMRVGRGRERWWAEKRHGTLFYPEDAIREFIAARTVPRGERLLPRPFPGRLPGGKKARNAMPADREAQPPPPVAGEELRLIPATDAAAWLGVRTGALYDWRRRGIGPAYVRLPGGWWRHGKLLAPVHYPVQELAAFADAWLIEATLLHSRRSPRGRAGEAVCAQGSEMANDAMLGSARS